ncbi:MAG: ACT domain-containing protein, partial [Fusobacterium sp.]|nr:ACT domain-containing protein [Fusobacterium sp.]
CTYLSEANINILDISQTIVNGYFNMMMIVDITNVSKSMEIVDDEIKELGKDLGVIISMQHEDIFRSMHRI